MQVIHRNFIAGEWVGSADRTLNINPSDTNDVVGEYCRADLSQVKAAIAAARSAFPSWARSSPQLRCDILDKIGAEILLRRPELGELLAREEGKTLPEAVGEVTRAG
jgi:alpha-ketoglutaric semialdehyde dehydrogenase